MSKRGVNPYIGPQPFTRRDRTRFYGRERESRELLALVLSQRTVLFYAASGAGKSSLINARLIPALEERDYEVLPIARVSGVGRPAAAGERTDLNLFAYNLKQSLVPMALNGAASSLQRQYLDSSLSEFLLGLIAVPRDGDQEKTRFVLAGALDGEAQDAATDAAADTAPLAASDATPLAAAAPPALKPRCLVIDQFEEIFTANPQAWEQRDDFFRQLRRAQEDDPYLWVLFAMREDYLARLDPYLHLLPDRLRARYPMQRMGERAALQAIERPVAEWLPEPERRPFEPGVAQKLVDNLCLVRVATDQPGESRIERGEYVEPVQLQIVCYQMWEELRGSPGPQITLDDLARLAGEADLSRFVSRALQRYYEDAIAALLDDPPVPVSEQEIREWFSGRLITETGTRGFVQQGEHDTGGLPNSVVAVLERRFLVRSETRAGGIWYELTHDRFIDVIVSANREWLETRKTWLTGAVERWQRLDEDPDSLLRGEALNQALQWQHDHPGELSPLERRYVEDSVALREREGAARAAQRERELEMARELAKEAEARGRAEADRARAQARAARRLRWAVIALASGLAVALVAVGLALWQRMDAVRNARLAQASLRVALSSQLAAQAQTTLDERLDLALLLGVAGTQLADTMAARGSLIAALEHSPHLEAFLWGHDDAVVSLAFAPDGRSLASISTAGAVIHWEAAHQIERGPASLPGGPFAAAALSPDGATLALGGADGTLSLWDVASSPPTRLRAASGGSTVSSLAFSPDGKQLAAGDWDRTIRLWDVSSMELDGVLEGHQDIVSSVAYSPDGRTLASGGADGAVLLWDLVNAAVRDSGDARRPTAWVWSLAFSPDGKTLAIGAADGSIALWDLGGRYLANRDLGRGKSFALSSSVLSLAFSPNGETLASGDAAGAVTLWDLANPERAGQSLSGHTGGVRAIVFSPSGNALASGATDGGVILWRVDPETQSEGRALYTLGRGASSIALSPDGTTLAFHDCDPARTSCGFLMLFDLQENQGIKAVDGDTSPISNLAFGPGGVRLAGQHSDGSISVWDMRPGGGRVSRLLSEQSVACLAFTADERALATAARDGAVTLWDINDGSTTTYQAKEGVLVTAFSPDGTLWATGYDSGMVTVRELASGEQIRETRHSSAVSALAFGPSGEALVIGSGDGTLLVWDLEADTTAVQPAGDQASLVLSLAYSRDGSRFAAGYASGALLLCAGRGQQPACLPLSTQGNGLVALAFRGDGRRLVVRDDAGTVLIRDLSVDAWVDRACHIVNRALTAREWEQFVAGEPYQPTCERAEKEEGNGEQ